MHGLGWKKGLSLIGHKLLSQWISHEDGEKTMLFYPCLTERLGKAM